MDDMDERTTREILAEMLREIGGRYDGDELDRYVEGELNENYPSCVSGA